MRKSPKVVDLGCHARPRPSLAGALQRALSEHAEIDCKPKPTFRERITARIRSFGAWLMNVGR